MFLFFRDFCRCLCVERLYRVLLGELVGGGGWAWRVFILWRVVFGGIVVGSLFEVFRGGFGFISGLGKV